MSDSRGIISERLSAARMDLGLTMEKVAQRMGFSRARYSNWELGIREPRYRDLEIAANVLGVSPAYLVGWSDQPTGSPYQPIDRATVPGGDGKDAIHLANATDIVAYRDSYLQRRNLTPRNLLSIRIEDDTMADVVRRNDVVLVDMNKRRSEIRDLFAILHGDRVWVRWIRPELNGNFTLSAENKASYPDETLTPEQLDGLDVIGRIARIERDV